MEQAGGREMVLVIARNTEYIVSKSIKGSDRSLGNQTLCTAQAFASSSLPIFETSHRLRSLR
jgi:hypothetical protein